MLLDEKVAIVTGAAKARGIGLATAQLFAAHGARVALLDQDGDAARAAVASIGPDHLGLACNVRDADACAAAAITKRVDVLVNSAGITQKRGAMDVTQEDYDLVTDMVLRGTLMMSQSVIPCMKE
jgi:NAD(P)-dependent dehydrogenase (short-subunit alcohol dehydrogenase family)